MTSGAAPKTQLHRDRIRAGVKLAQEDNRRSGRPINQWPIGYVVRRDRTCKNGCDRPVKALDVCQRCYRKAGGK